MDRPPMFDISRLDFWKAKMSSHLKALDSRVYQVITKESYPNDSKHRKANALALKTLRVSPVSYTHLTLPTKRIV